MPDGHGTVRAARLWELASHGNRAVGLRDAALPFMVDLQSAVHEIVTLAVLDGETALFLERLAPAQTTLEAGRIMRTAAAGISRTLVGPH